MADQQRPNVGTAGPRVMTITSGKGGVGKSTIAVNLALTLSEFGNNVLLVDGDANLGSVDVMLGVSPKWRLRNVLENELTVEDALVSPYPRLKVLAGNSGDSDYPLMDLERQSRLLDELTSTEEHFDLVLIDTAAGLSREIVNYAIHSHEVLIVTNAEPTSVMDAYAAMKMIWASCSETPLSFFMNAVRNPKEAADAAEKLQMAVTHFLNIRVKNLGSIPFDESVPESILRQQPVIVSAPYCAAALSIQAIAQRYHVPYAAQRKRERTVA